MSSKKERDNEDKLVSESEIIILIREEIQKYYFQLRKLRSL